MTTKRERNGWPDLLSASDWKRYEAAVKHGCKGLTNISSGACPGCEECGLEENAGDHERDAASESYFSWSACDICNRNLGGARIPAHAFMTGAHGQKILVHLAICWECQSYLEYGKPQDAP